MVKSKKPEQNLRPLESFDDSKKKLRQIFMNLASDIAESKPPVLRIPVRTASNTVYDEHRQILTLGERMSERRFNDISEVRSFMQTLLLARGIYEALQHDDHPTIRDLYYYTLHTIEGTNIETFNSQDESNNIFQDIEVMTGLLREQMGVVAESRGALVGEIVLQSKGNKIDCSKFGIGAFNIPSLCDQIQIVSVDADYVLVVEKDAIFQRLNDYEFWRRNKCVLITGKGQADRATRRMVRRLNEEWGLPVYVLTDADPFGWYIYSTYRAGSISLSYESFRLACPDAKFLGLTMTDLEKYEVPKDHLIKANEMDIKRAKELLVRDPKTKKPRYPWFYESKRWRQEIHLFLDRRVKAEIEAKSSKGFRFLSDVYLPEKLANKDWII
ncbi:MAG: DNA topoisomerase IV subunit A [Candidatus Verstraetearchaeota archaeon]|nr:DNA topoisomerase IV subunit A [Candidatus Verstraetearchaeota archaeon]